jgi:hypothetical protein
VPRSLPPIDATDPGWRDRPGVFAAATLEALAARAAPSHDRTSSGPAALDEATGAEIQPQLERIAAELKELRRRLERISEVAERSQHGVSQVHQRLVHLEMQVTGITNNRIARFLRGLGLFRLLRAIGIWGRAG